MVSCTVLNSGMPYTWSSSVTWSSAAGTNIAGVDALAVDAAVERHDRAARGERADLVAVGVDDVGRLARGDGREELLQVEVALDELDLDVAERFLGQVHAGRRDLVDPREPHHRQAARELGVRVVLGIGVVGAARSDGAARDEGGARGAGKYGGEHAAWKSA